MTEQTEAFYQVYVPTFSERVWNALGIRGARTPWKETDALREREPTRWAHDGEIIFSSRVNFSGWDRLRFLLTGCVEIQGRMVTSVAVPDAHAFINWGIARPFKRHLSMAAHTEGGE